ncbi:MAG: 50S ribosomal protein L11 methyltransferase [Chloroflexi bacterium]|nr:50S ribosomal protein L11 methyltransferase [Chloroflexota bacterium]
MNWIELSIATDAEGAEAAAALLNEFVSGGAVIEETLIAETGEPIDPARAFTVRAFFSSDNRDQVARAETALWHLSQLRAMTTPQTRELAEEDWAEAWKKHYTILHIGKHLVIKPSWLEYSARADDVVIELDPGMAFGTGLHPTTRMCMAALEEQMAHPSTALRSAQDAAWTMLDVGCGSGILSITAAKLGARKIRALDLDAIAVETTARNVAINRADSIVRVEHRSIDADRDCNQFDLVCINILAEIICELAPTVASALRAGGIVIASGILDFKAADVRDAFAEFGIDVIEKKQEEDWVTLIGVKNNSDQPQLSNYSTTQQSN